MNIKRISGITLLLISVALFFLADYITGQVEEGKRKVTKGQEQVNTIRDLSGSNPYTKDLGGFFADSGQKKIDKGKEEISKYDNLVVKIQIASAIIFAVGGLLIVYSFFRKQKFSK